jgi:hypothetical protein
MVWAGSHICRLALWIKHIGPFSNKCLSLHLSLSTYFHLLHVQFKTSLHLKLFTTLIIPIQQNIRVLTHMHKTQLTLTHCACHWNTSVTNITHSSVWLHHVPSLPKSKLFSWDITVGTVVCFTIPCWLIFSPEHKTAASYIMLLPIYRLHGTKS